MLLKFKKIGKIGIYGIIIAALMAGGFSACQMDELAGVRPPAKRGSDDSLAQATPYLESLSLDNGLTLKPPFAPNVVSYSVDLSNLPPETTTITATAATGFTIDYRTGKTFAPSPVNPAQIVVTNPENGTSTNYIIVFNPSSEPLPAARLLDIQLSQGTIDNFDPDFSTYPVRVPYGTVEVAVVPIPEDDGSLFTFNPGVTITPVAGETKTVTIGVVSPNHSLGEYQVSIEIDAAQESRLANVNLSAGSLDPPFDAETFTYTINIHEGTNPFVVDAVRISSADTVSFVELPSGAILSENATAAFTRADLDGTSFTITVYQGLGYIPQEYTFAIATSEMLPALLASIGFANGGPPVGTLHRGLPEAPAGTGFEPNTFTYTLEFAHDAAALMTAEGQLGVTAASGTNTGSSITVNYNPLQASKLLENSTIPVRNFVTITAQKPAHIDSTYTVYFKKSPLPRATLDKLEVFGGTLVLSSDGVSTITDSEVQDTQTFDSFNKKQYTINAMANTQAVIVEGTPKANTFIGVTYDEKNFVSNLQYGLPSPRITVNVSDGELDYADTAYELTVNVLEAQNPRLEALAINGDAVTLDDSRLVYAHTIPYNNYADGGKPAVAWTPNVSVNEVKFSFNSGSTWLPDSEKNGFTAAEAADCVIPYSQTKHILVKLRAIDGTEAVYTLIITQEGNPSANLTDIEVYDASTGGNSLTIKQRIDQTSGFSPAVYAYDVKTPNGTGAAYVVPVGQPAGAAVTYSIDGGASQPYTTGRIAVTGLLITDAKTLSISVQPQGGGAPNVYTLYIKQDANSEALLLQLDIPSGTTTAGLVTVAPPSFASGTGYYTVTLPFDFTGSVTFTPRQISFGARLYKCITIPGIAPVFSDEIPSLPSTVVVDGVTGATPKTLSLRVTAQNGVDSTTYHFYITQSKNDQAQITALTTSLALNESFAPETYAYSGEVTNGSAIAITPTAISAGASMSYKIITNNTELTVPETPLTPGTQIPSVAVSAANQTKMVVITVVSQDGATIHSYTFHITRPGNTAADILTLTNSAGTLNVNGAPVSFTSQNHNYTVVVPVGTASTTIKPLTISPGASISARIDNAAVEPPLAASADGTVTNNTIVVNIGATAPGTPKILTLTVTPQSGAAAGVYTFYVTHVPSTETNIPVGFTLQQSSGGSYYLYNGGNTGSGNSHTLTPEYRYMNIKIKPTFTPAATGAVLKYRGHDDTSFVQADTTSGHAITGLEVFVPKTVVFQVFSEAGTPGQMYTFTIIRQPNTDTNLQISTVSKKTGGAFGQGKIIFSPTASENMFDIVVQDIFLEKNDSMNNQNDYLTEIDTINFTIPSEAKLYSIVNSSEISGTYTYPFSIGRNVDSSMVSVLLLPQAASIAPKLYTVRVKRQYSRLITADETWTPFAGEHSYKISCYGASGGNVIGISSEGGRGGYSEGTTSLTNANVLTIKVGGKGGDGGNNGTGATGTGGANGGGAGCAGDSRIGGGGGGATDIRKGGDGLQHRIMVAGGGGGTYGRGNGAKGGGGYHGDAEFLEPVHGDNNDQANGNFSARWSGSDAIGFADGVGQNATTSNNKACGGGGGGYKGGFAANSAKNENNGGGGSGHIDIYVFTDYKGGHRDVLNNAVYPEKPALLKFEDLASKGFVVIELNP
ncbi:MAG: cadherin-like beta sandwich domain-containing protein [Spirochaetaceae bacterium]|jgi:hypothetical protein|nr:cadherin-like beta sandwich domain-containing protein [Spirochaetaceae bacterium]